LDRNLLLPLFPISIFPPSGFPRIMRGLLKASLLLAPALASAFVVPTGVEDINKVEGARIAGN
jgi:hypothetical protein